MLFALHQQPPSSPDLTDDCRQIVLLLLPCPKCCSGHISQNAPNRPGQALSGAVPRPATPTLATSAPRRVRLHVLDLDYSCVYYLPALSSFRRGWPGQSRAARSLDIVICLLALLGNRVARHAPRLAHARRSPATPATSTYQEIWIVRSIYKST